MEFRQEFCEAIASYVSTEHQEAYQTETEVLEDVKAEAIAHFRKLMHVIGADSINKFVDSDEYKRLLISTSYDVLSAIEHAKKNDADVDVVEIERYIKWHAIETLVAFIG